MLSLSGSLSQLQDLYYKLHVGSGKLLEARGLAYSVEILHNEVEGALTESVSGMLVTGKEDTSCVICVKVHQDGLLTHLLQSFDSELVALLEYFHNIVDGYLTLVSVEVGEHLNQDLEPHGAKLDLTTTFLSLGMQRKVREHRCEVGATG